MIKRTSPIIKVIGIGGAGQNILGSMIRAQIHGIEFIAADTDFQFLEKSAAPVKIHLGRNTTMGLGAGSNPEKGREAAQESCKEIDKALEGADMVILVAGMGGGTGTGASEIIADASRSLGVYTSGIVTLPFSREGKQRMARSEEGVRELGKQLASLIVKPNDQLTAFKAPKNLDELFRAETIFIDALREIIGTNERKAG